MPHVPPPPNLPPELEAVWEAFCFLSNARSFGVVPNPISAEAIVAVLDEWQIEGEDRRDWASWLQRLDQHWLQRMNEKQPEQPSR